MAGWRQTSRQRQADRQADTGGQAVEHRRANSQTSKQTYWQTFTHAHGDVDKHWGYSAYPLLSLDVCWQQSKSISTCHKYPASIYVPLEGKFSTLRHFEPASFAYSGSFLNQCFQYYMVQGRGRQAGRLAGRPAGKPAGRLTCRRLCCAR